MMTPVISEVLIILLFAVPSAAWRSSSHHQLQQQLQSRSHYSIGSMCTSSSLLLASSPMVYDDFISREGWQALSQEDRNNIHEQRRLANPNVDSDAPSPTSTITTSVETTTTAIVADISVNAPSNPSFNKDDDGRYKGTVKWFNMRKGFGFVIRDDNKKDVFVHQTSIQSEGFRGLQSGEVVEFEIETIGEQTSAVNVTKPGGKRLKEENKSTVAITTVEPKAEMKKEYVPSSSETIKEETKVPPVAPALVSVAKQEETKTPASFPIAKEEETKPATSPASSRDEDLRLTLQVIMDHAHRSTTVSKEQLIHQMEESKKKEQSNEIEIEIDTTDNDVSIPYMATAQLAFEQSDKSVSYDEFERKYLADSVQDVIEKRL